MHSQRLMGTFTGTETVHSQQNLEGIVTGTDTVHSRRASSHRTEMLHRCRRGGGGRLVWWWGWAVGVVVGVGDWCGGGGGWLELVSGVLTKLRRFTAAWRLVITELKYCTQAEYR